jgi:DNA-binding Lrp family transcriptional regulator
MKHTRNQSSNSQSLDRKLLRLLRQNGAQTINVLATSTGFEWGQVFQSVDRLSRNGKVSLTAVYPSEYCVSARHAVHPA